MKSGYFRLPRWASIGLALLLLIPLWASAAMADRTYRFTILHTNDHHGHFWQNAQGEYGLAAQKTLMDRLRYDAQAQGGGALILSAGDINTGVPESDEQSAEPDIRGMNLIGYNAMALGNHEFDGPLSVLRKQQQWARFPFLAANIYQKGSDKRLFQPWGLFNRMGLKIAVLGLATPDTRKLTDPDRLSNLDFRDPVSETLKAVAELRAKEKPDVIVVLSHLGYDENGEHGSNAAGDVTLARSLPPGTIDMIVGGHSHDTLCMAKENALINAYQPGTACQPDRQNGVWIMQAGKWGEFVGRADFTWRKGKLALSSYALIPVNLGRNISNSDGSKSWLTWQQAIPADSGMMKLLMPFQKRGEARLGTVVGQTIGQFNGERELVRSTQTSLGQLILRSQMAKTHADLAAISGGVIRASLPVGTLRLRDLLQAQPFANQIVSVSLSGAEIKDYLQVVANISPGGGFAQLAGVTLTLKAGQVSDVRINGEPLQADKQYRLATNSFNATGGDGYPRLDKHPSYQHTDTTDVQVLREYVKAHTPLNASDYDAAAVVKRAADGR